MDFGKKASYVKANTTRQCIFTRGKQLEHKILQISLFQLPEAKFYAY